MLNRQKTLLLLLHLAGRPVSREELTRWAFILREEMPSHGGNTFYDFLPYKYGPFSFCLHREMDGLIRDGYVEDGDFWTTTALALEFAQTLSEAIRHDGRQLVERFAKKPVNRVVDYIDSKYPRFNTSTDKKVVKESVAPPAVYTAGYERLSVDAFLNRLIQNGIQRIIDVRNNPVARRYGFHKSTLAQLGGRIGVQYVHVPELGIQPALRQNLISPDDYDALFDRYVAETLVDEPLAINRVVDLMAKKPSVLVCMEADPRFCHRSRLAETVSQATGLPIQDLGCSTT